MLRLPLFVFPAAAALVGCATAMPSATPGSPTLSMASVAEPVDVPAAGASAWREVEPATTMAPSMSASKSPEYSSSSDTHLTLMVGERWLDEDDWGDFDNPVAYGLEVDGSNHEGHGYEVGVFYTNEDENDLGNISGLDGETTTWELYGGYRYTFNQGEDVHPFVSVGVGAENGELEASTPFGSDSDDDTVLGAYARAGLLWDLGERIRLGLDYRHFFGQDLEVNIAGADISADSDYDQVLLTLGWGF